MIVKDIVTFKDDNKVILKWKTYEGTQGLFRLLYYIVYASPEFHTLEIFKNYKEIPIETESIYHNS